MEKEEVYLDPGTKTLMVKGEKYAFKKTTYKKGGEKKGHLSREIWEKVDEKEYAKRIETIIDKLVDHVDKRKILKSTLEGVSLVDLEKIELRLKKGVKIKEKGGCYNLMIGDYELPLAY